MDLRFTPEEVAFREEVRTFIKENLPADIHHRMKLGYAPRKEDTVRWQRILNAKGWAGLSWPKEHGGTGWTAIQKMIFLEENQAAPAPELSSFNITMIGPVLIQFGTDAQKKRFLPRAANIDDWWCQGFSEPGAGSDLASLKTAAKREGDVYVVNGQKIWTSTAHVADWCFLLVRTDPNARKRQEGISFLLVDMKTPGITVRPIISIDGSHHLNEVFFDDVKVPVENLVHQENKGWDVAKFLLGNERTGIARLGKSRERLEASLDMARKVNQHGRPLVEDAEFRKRVAQIQVDMKALEITQYRVLSNYDKAKGGKPDPLSSVLKVKGTELLQATTEMAVDVAGPMATPIWAQELEAMNQPDDMLEASSAGVGSYLFLRAATIYGGTNEIQKNILTKAVLGL
ncbi:MAG: acyl-CoA dehydrogenase family protein [Acetobacteraceae bacterium]